MTNLKIEEKMDGARIRTAESLESAADSVRAAGAEGARAIGDLANEAGEKLESTATCVRTFTGDDVLGNLRHTVRRNPVGSLAFAAAVGVVAGFSWRSSCRRSGAAS